MKQQSTCEACGSCKQKDKTKEQSTCVACHGCKQTKQTKEQSTCMACHSHKKEKTKQQSTCVASCSFKQKTKQPSTCVACHGCKQETNNQPVSWVVGLQSGGKQSSSERAKNYLPVLAVTSKKQKNTQYVQPVAAASKTKLPQARQNHGGLSRMKQQSTCMACCGCKEKTTCELGGGSPRAGKKQSCSEQAKTLFTCACSCSRKATKQHVSTSQGNKQSTYMHDKNKQHVA